MMKPTLLVLMAMMPTVTLGETIVVGEPFGWQSGQPYDKIEASVGDVLFFQYGVNHNVWEVPNSGCEFSAGTLLSANTASPYIHTLNEPGTFFFACGTGGHCQSGQNVEVHVVDPSEGEEEEGSDPNSLCLPSRCDIQALSLPAEVTPGELGGVLQPQYDAQCADATSMECASFINNMQACARAELWEEGMEERAQYIAPYLGTFVRSWATTVGQIRDAMSVVPPSGLNDVEDEEGFSCPPGQVMGHMPSALAMSYAPDLGLQDTDCAAFCLPEAFAAFSPGQDGPCADGMVPGETMTITMDGSPMPLQVTIFSKGEEGSSMGPMECSGGEVTAVVMGSAGYGAEEGQCSEFCTMAFAVAFVPGAKTGSCAEEGFKALVKEEMMTPAGSPMPMLVRVFEMKEGQEMEEEDITPEVNRDEEGWCEWEYGQGLDGRDVVTCYSLALPMFPGQVINSNYALPNPFTEEKAVYRRGAWVVDGDLVEVSLGEIYVHHLGSSIVGGVGAEFRGWTPPFPDNRRLLIGPYTPGFANLHLINTVGVPDEGVLPCIECWCDRPEGDLEITEFGDKSGVDCCYDCASTAEPVPTNYHLKYSFEVEPVTEETVAMEQIWMDIIPGKIEYDVPAAGPGEDPVQVVEHETLIDYSAPQTGPLTIHRCAAHLHIASLGMWMYDAITGEELCSVGVVNGAGGRYEIGNEGGYLVRVEPTVYEPAMVMEPGHPIRLVAKYNATEYHGGVMALLWIDVESQGLTSQGNFFNNFDAAAFAPPLCPSRDPPSAVRHLHAVDIDSSGTFTLMWAQPQLSFDCNKDLYSVEVARRGSDQFEVVPFMGMSVVPSAMDREFFGSDTVTTLTLDPAYEYDVRVTAYKRRVAADAITMPREGEDGVGPSSSIVVSFNKGDHQDQGECVDLKARVSWYDSDGPKYNCDWYNPSRCRKNPARYTHWDLDATQACCVCKDEGEQCEDTVISLDWYDKGGKDYDCDYYAANPGACDSFAMSRGNLGLTAREACCACGGGAIESEFRAN